MAVQKKKQSKDLHKLNSVNIGYTRGSSLNDRQKLGLSVQTEALRACDVLFQEKPQSGMGVYS